MVISQWRVFLWVAIFSVSTGIKVVQNLQYIVAFKSISTGVQYNDAIRFQVVACICSVTGHS